MTPTAGVVAQQAPDEARRCHEGVKEPVRQRVVDEGRGAFCHGSKSKYNSKGLPASNTALTGAATWKGQAG